MMVLLEIKFAILVEEMHAGTIVAEERTGGFKEIVIRAEPEFNRSGSHRIDQVDSCRSDFTTL